MGATTSAVILSTGRTGTMFFAHLLRELVPQAAVYHEAGERSRLINILTHVHLSGFLPIQAPLWAWHRAVAPELETCSKKTYIDSNNHIYALVTLIPELYPGLRVIHLVRDPRDYVRSHINWSRHRLKSFIANYLIPFWQPNGWLLKEMPVGRWLRLTQLERFSWIWDFKNRTIGQMEDSETPYLRIKFEDFFDNADPLSHFNKLLDFLEFERVSGIKAFFQNPVNPTKNKSLPKWNFWSHKQCQQLNNICGLTMAKYGYGEEEEWREMFRSSWKNET